MLTVETPADIAEDGALRATLPGHAPRGRHRAVIVIGEPAESSRRMPELLAEMGRLRGSLVCRPHPGNSVVDARAEERQ
jgi:hypothetical protein